MLSCSAQRGGGGGGGDSTYSMLGWKLAKLNLHGRIVDEGDHFCATAAEAAAFAAGTGV